MYDLPLFQRNVTNILRLTPGVAYEGYSLGIGAGHVAGLRDTAIGVYEDGVGANSPMGNTRIVRPILNAVEEVKLVTTAPPAEYGAVGGVIDVVRKSGTNEIHGLASNYGRSRRTQHRLFFDQQKTSTPKPGFPSGEPTFFMMPDANVGGPIRLPGLYDGRNKSFFFFAYQKLIEKKLAQAFSNAPTPDMKRGDFNFGGVGNELWDPATTRQLPNGTWVRDPRPNRIVPLSRWDPVARKVIEIDPWVPPNRLDTPTPTGPSRTSSTARTPACSTSITPARSTTSSARNSRSTGPGATSTRTAPEGPRATSGISTSTPPTATPRRKPIRTSRSARPG